MALAPGTQLNQYEIVAEIGAGGMGEVYRARDTKLGRDVAIKLLRHDAVTNQERLKRFEQEARAASALSHPNIVTIYEIGEHEGVPYIAMEYIAGRTLRELLVGGPLPNDRLVRFAIQIAEGLTKAHQAGIVHRDLKPENIVVSEDGYVKILDFGLAKLLSAGVVDSEAETEEKEGTTPGSFLGTVGYMSPEQAKGYTVEFRSDHFSLGAVFYEMATGQRAFGRDTPAETLAALLTEEPKLDGRLGEIVQRCLKKDPNERWNDTKDLLRALTSLELPNDTTPKKPSVAVLPFINMSGDPEQEYFCDGMAEEIINALAHIKGLRVVARTSAFALKGKDLDAREIGKTLNVGTLLEGSVRKSGNRIRITAQLINVADGYHLWSERFDRDLADVFAIQDEISVAVVEKLKAELLAHEKTRITKRNQGSIEAYQHCLVGRHHWYNFTEEGNKTALKHYEQALALEPASALAHAGLGDLYLASGGCGLNLFRGIDALPKAKSHAEKAIANDPSLGQAHGTLGLIRTWFELDWSGAERAMNRGVDVEPSSPLPHIDRSHYLNIVGRHEEAIEEIQHAIELDPVSPLLFHIAAGHLYCARRFDEALEFCERASGDFDLLGQAMGLLLLQKGRVEEAIERLEAARSHWPGGIDPLLGYAYGRAGRHKNATQMARDIEQKIREGWGSATELALVHMGLGETGEALKQLDAALAEPPFARSFYLSYLKVDPIWDPLRSDPHFQDLLRRMNYPS